MEGEGGRASDDHMMSLSVPAEGPSQNFLHEKRQQEVPLLATRTPTDS